jgi:hypothetical protein
VIDKNYKLVKAWAEEQARQLRIDVGIEKMHDPFRGGVIYSAKYLPKPEKRFGWELRCEVVKGRREDNGS